VGWKNDYGLVIFRLASVGLLEMNAKMFVVDKYGAEKLFLDYVEYNNYYH